MRELSFSSVFLGHAVVYSLPPPPTLTSYIYRTSVPSRRQYWIIRRNLALGPSKLASGHRTNAYSCIPSRRTRNIVRQKLQTRTHSLHTRCVRNIFNCAYSHLISTATFCLEYARNPHARPAWHHPLRDQERVVKSLNFVKACGFDSLGDFLAVICGRQEDAPRVFSGHAQATASLVKKGWTGTHSIDILRL